MEQASLFIVIGVVLLIFAVIDKIPKDWREVAGGLMFLLLIADSVIAGIRALLR